MTQVLIDRTSQAQRSEVMKSAYVIMSRFYSPLVFCIPTPKTVVGTKKAAEKLCKEHNENRRTSTEWYWRKVKVEV